MTMPLVAYIYCIVILLLDKFMVMRVWWQVADTIMTQGTLEGGMEMPQWAVTRTPTETPPWPPPCSCVSCK